MRRWRSTNRRNEDGVRADVLPEDPTPAGAHPHCDGQDASPAAGQDGQAGQEGGRPAPADVGTPGPDTASPDAVLSEAEHLRKALASRTTTATAIGILMAQRRITSEDAFTWLVRLSQHTNEKLTSIAGRIVSEAEERAKS